MRLQQPQLPAAPNDKFLGDLVFKVKSILTGIVNAVNGKAASGANSDITALTGLTTALTVAQGGTGAASPSAARGNLGAAASGSNADITALTALASINGGPLAGLRNAIINGAFGINQRGASGTVTLAAGAYGHDRWKAGAGGCTYTFAASGNHTVITISAGSLMQVIEGANIETGPYVLSHQGSAQARIGINGAAPAGAYAAATAAAPLAVTPTGSQSVTVEFGTGTVDRAQFEPGNVATVFERRFYGQELVLCQRYYQTTPYYLRGLFLSNTLARFFYDFPVEMRAAPSMRLLKTSFGVEETGVALHNATGASLSSVGSDTKSALIQIAATYAGTVTTQSHAQTNDERIAELSAEL